MPETPVKQTDVPGEWTSPTQPIPSKPPAFGQQSLKESDLIDFTPALRQEAIAALKASNLRYGEIFMPGSLANAPDGTRGTVMFFGGANWWGGRADPEDGFVYVSSSTGPYVIALRPNTPAPNAPPANPALPLFDEWLALSTNAGKEGDEIDEQQFRPLSRPSFGYCGFGDAAPRKTGSRLPGVV